MDYKNKKRIKGKYWRNNALYIKRKRTNGFDSDDEDFDSPDTISNELDKDDEEEEYLQTALKKAMISLGSTLSTFR